MMPAHDKITIIVPIYNVYEYLERCVNSILKQSYTNLEIILVNDGSTDGSGMLCDKFKNMDNRIIVIHKKNGGLSEARNYGLEVMNGKYLFFVDSDDYILDYIIEELYLACIRNNADVACCGYKNILNSYYENKAETVMTGMEATKKMLIMDGVDANAFCKLYKKELFNEVRFPVGCLYETVPIMHRILLNAACVVNIGKCGYFIEMRPTSITRCYFNHRHMQFIEFTKQVYENMKVEYPELTESAYTFYLYSIVTTAEKLVIDKVNKQDNNYKFAMKLFNDNIGKMILSETLIKRKKIIALLIKFKLYRLVWFIVHYKKSDFFGSN